MYLTQLELGSNNFVLKTDSETLMSCDVILEYIARLDVTSVSESCVAVYIIGNV